MKTRTILIALFALCLALPSHAQFWKKLQKKAEDAVERTVLNRTDKEVSEQTDEAIDGVLESKKDGNNSSSNKIGETEKNEPQASEVSQEKADARAAAMQKKLENMMGGANLDKIPELYHFSYQATMQLTGHKNEMQMQYLMEPDATYFGSKLLDEKTNNISVIDLDNQAMVMFMNQQGEKMMMSVNYSKKLFDKMYNNQNAETQEYMANLKEIQGKTILGYACKGYESTTVEGTTRVWVTNETPVGFMGAGMIENQNLPESVIKLGTNAMIMEMEYTPAKKKKDYFHMICIEFGEESLDIKKSEYKSMGGFK